jgi:hypothetical protein
MDTMRQGRAYRVECLEEPTLGGSGGDVGARFPSSSAPQFFQEDIMDEMAIGRVSFRDDLRYRGIRRVQDRKPNAKLVTMLARLAKPQRTA